MADKLHYCTLDQIQSVLMAAGRFDELFELTRDAVTGLFNAYMRRDLSYGNVTEYFDAGAVGRGAPYYLYLAKREIEDGTLVINNDSRRLWGTSSLVENAQIDLTLGKVTMFGPSRFSPQSIRVSYFGGYKAREDDEAVMACPSEITSAALSQCAFMLKDQINNNAGSREEDRGRQVVQKVKLVGGLIEPVAAVLNEYRRPLMRVI